MKKSLFMLTLLAIMTGMSSCRYYTQCDCPQNGGGSTCYYHNKVIDFTVRASQWQLSDDGTYLYAVIENDGMEALTKTVYEDGMVSCYAKFTGQGGDSYQLALPATTFLSYPWTNPQTEETQTIFYQEKLDFVYGIGWMEIDLQCSDFEIGDEQKRDHTFRVFMQW